MLYRPSCGPRKRGEALSAKDVDRRSRVFFRVKPATSNGETSSERQEILHRDQVCFEVVESDRACRRHRYGIGVRRKGSGDRYCIFECGKAKRDGRRTLSAVFQEIGAYRAQMLELRRYVDVRGVNAVGADSELVQQQTKLAVENERGSSNEGRAAVDRRLEGPSSRVTRRV